MSETAEELEQEEVVEETAEKPDEEKLTPEQSYEAKQEEKASQEGWKPYDEFVENGGDPEKWVPAAIFNVRGEFIGKLKDQDKQFNERLQGVNQLHEAQLKIQREELMSERADAIKEGGQQAVDRVAAIDKQLDTLSQAPVQNAVPPELQEWNQKNSWIKQAGARSVFAQTNFAQAIQAGKSITDAIKHVEELDRRDFPQTTTKKPKEPAALSEGGSKPGSKPSPKSLTWEDLTSDEVKIYNAMPGGWKDKAHYLKAVADARKSE